MSLTGAPCNIDFGGNELSFIIVLSLVSMVLSIIFIFWTSVICLIHFKIRTRDFGHENVRNKIRGSCSDSRTLVAAESKQTLDDKRTSALDSVEHHGTFRQHHVVKNGMQKEEEARYVGIDEIKEKEGTASDNNISVMKNPNYQETRMDENTYDTLQEKGDMQDRGDKKEKCESYENLAEVRERVNTGERKRKPPKEQRNADPTSKMVQMVKLKDSEDSDMSPLMIPEENSIAQANPVYDQLNEP